LFKIQKLMFVSNNVFRERKNNGVNIHIYRDDLFLEMEMAINRRRRHRRRRRYKKLWVPRNGRPKDSKF